MWRTQHQLSGVTYWLEADMFKRHPITIHQQWTCDRSGTLAYTEGSIAATLIRQVLEGR